MKTTLSSTCISMTRFFLNTGSNMRLTCMTLVALLLATTGYVRAQEAYPVGFESSVVYTGLSAPGGVAVDKLGNVYISDTSNNRILIETFQTNGTYVQSTLSNGTCGDSPLPACFNQPNGVAVDASGNLFIANTVGNNVMKAVPAGGGLYTLSTLFSKPFGGVYTPTGIALDASDNVYVTDSSNIDAVIVAYASTSYTTYTLLDSNSSAGVSTYSPDGIAVDSNLNVFVGDLVEGLIEIPRSGGTWGTPINLGTGLHGPRGVAVDAQNNVYVANAGAGGSVVEEVLQFDGSYVQQAIAASGLSSVDAIAVDSRYNIFVSVPNTNQVIEISPFNGNFGNVNIGSTSLRNLTVTFEFAQPGILSNIIAVQKGDNNGEFALVPGGTNPCTTGGSGYNQGDTCTVTVNFTPQFAGTRYGAVELINSYGELFGTAYIFGTGVGPQVVFLPGVIYQLGFSQANGDVLTMAVDGSDNVFYTSSNDNYFYEMTAASGYLNVTRFGGGIVSPSDVQTDGAGNVYISAWSSYVLKFYAQDNFQTYLTMYAGSGAVDGSCVDGNGNVYVVTASGQVLEILATSQYTQIIQLASGLGVLADVGVDGSGDVFALNYTNGNVNELMAVNGAVPSNPVINTIATGLSGPQSIKVDNVGNLFIADNGHNAIDEWTLASGYTTKVIAAAVPGPYDMAVDGQGNLFYDASAGSMNGYTYEQGEILEQSEGLAPTLYFNATVIGNTSTDSPQTVSIQNIGNVPLTFPVLSSGNNPSITSDFWWKQSVTTGSDPNCQLAPNSLAVQAECSYPISFTPVSGGNIIGQLVLTDNTLYAQAPTYGQQIINLNGTGLGATMTVTADSYTIAFGQTIPTFGYQLIGPLGSAMCTGAPSIVASPQPVGAIGVYTLTITKGNLNCGAKYSSYNFVNGTLTITKQTVILTLTTKSTSIVYGTPIPSLASNYKLTGFINGDTQASTCTGAPVISTTATNASPVGSYPILGDAGSLACTLDVNIVYTINIVNSGILTIGKDMPVITWAPVPSSMSYGSTMVAGQFDAVATNSNNSTNVSADGTFVYRLTSTSGAIISVGTQLPAGTDTLCAVWTPVTFWATDFNSANVCITMVVSGQTPTIQWTPTPNPTFYGVLPTTAGDLTATAWAVISGTNTNISADGTFSFWVGSTCSGTTFSTSTVLPVGTDSVSVKWTPSSSYNTQFTSVCYTTTIVVNQAPTQINWTPGQTNWTFGAGLTAGILNSTVSNTATGASPVIITADGTTTYTYYPSYPVLTGGIVVTAGYTTLPLGSDTICSSWAPLTSPTNYSLDFQVPAKNCVAFTVGVATPTLGWIPPTTTMTYGATFGASNTNATAINNTTGANTSVAADGTFTYTYYPNYPLLTSPSTVTSGTKLPGGTDVVCATWAPSSGYTSDFSGTSPSSVCVTFTINPAAATLTLTTSNNTMVYGAAVPSVAGNWAIGGFQGTDTQANSCTGAANVSTTATSTSPVGSYPITATTGAPGNLICNSASKDYAYTINITNGGHMSITKYTGTVVLTSINGSSPYGITPVVSADYSLTGFVGADTQALVCSGAPSVTTTATAFSPASPPTYQITAAANTLNCALGSNLNSSYTITVASSPQAGKLTITQSTTTISWTPVLPSPYNYPTPIGAGALNATASIDSGAVSITSPTYGTFSYYIGSVGGPALTAGSILPAGVDTICVQFVPNATYSADITSASNCQTVTVGKASVTLTLATTSIFVPYASPIPSVAGDYTLTGFVLGDSQGVNCSGSPNVTTTAVINDPVGNYPITAATGAPGNLTCTSSNANYTINIVNGGNVVITQATNVPLTITTTNQTITYGTTPNVVNDYSLSGFIGTDTSAVCSGTPNITTTAIVNSPVGTYPITYNSAGTLVCGSANATYVITTVHSTGILTIVDMSGTGTGYNFGNVNVGTTAGPDAVTFTFNTAGDIGNVVVLTEGITGLDFADAGTGTCDTNGTGHIYNVGDTCTVNVTFTPKYPGLRTGAVEILDGDGNLVATAFVQGVGVGPEVIFPMNNGTTNLPASTTTVATSFTAPAGLALDGSNNLYVTDTTSNTVTQVIAAGGYTTSHGVGSSGGFSAPQGIAIDGAGNLFVADSGHNVVKEIVADGGYATVKSIYSSTTSPGGVAIDGSGNLFITYPNSTTAPVVELTYASGYSSATIIGASQFINSGGISLDSAGNLYVNDTGAGKLIEFTAASSYVTHSTLNAALTTPTGLVLDPNANAYISQGGGTSVSQLIANAYTNINNLGSLPGGIGYGIALDGAADLFAINVSTHQVIEFSYSAVPSLTFASTSYFVTSSDSPQTVGVFNFGNANLNLPVPGSGNDPSISSIDFTLASGTPPECPLVTSTTANISASQYCSLPVSYTPLPSGATTGTLTLTDNNLNVPNAQQVINLNGGAPTIATPTVTWVPVPPIATTYGTAIVLSQLDADAKVGSTDVSADGTFSYTYNGSNPITVGTFLPAGTYQICAIFTPSSGYTSELNSAQTCTSITISPAANVALTLTTTNAGPLPYESPIPVLNNNYTLSGFIGTDTSAVCSGTPVIGTTYTQGSVVGTYPINESSLGTLSCSSSNATYVISIIQNNGQLTIVQATTTLSWTPASLVYGQTLGAAQFNANAFAGAVNVNAQGTFTYYIGVVGGTVATTSTVLPYGPNTLCVQFVPTSPTYTADLTTVSMCTTVNVTAATLTITATPNATAVYNTPLPNASFTYVITGFVGSDNVGNVCTGAPVLSTPAVQGSPVGIYTVNVSTSSFVCSGYAFAINTGELHITPATLVIQPVSISAAYGSAVPAYDYTCSFQGTVLGTDSCGGGGFAITGKPSLTSSATSRAASSGAVYYTANVGGYTMYASFGSLKSVSGNFTFSFLTSPMSITTSPQTLTVQPNSFTEKQATCISSGFTLTYKLTGLLNWDTAASTTTGAASLSVPTYTPGSCAKGTYTIQSAPGTLQLDQYGGQTDYSGINYNAGTFTIN